MKIQKFDSFLKNITKLINYSLSDILSYSFKQMTMTLTVQKNLTTSLFAEEAQVKCEISYNGVNFYL